MSLPILFVSIHQPTILALTEAFSDIPNITFSLNNIRDMNFKPKTMFMSPANSIGFMDGGIDAAYMDMFHGVQKAVQTKIRSLGKKTTLGRFYLSVGSAIIVPVKNDSTLVSAPTMFLPHDVSKTRNAYHAMMAALMAFKKFGKCDLLVATGLCCGYGKMDPVVSAKQIREAYDDFNKGNVPEEIEHVSDPYCVITKNRDNEQPNNFDNREINEWK